MKYLFLDTNIYLHYIDVEQIDWNEVVGDTNITIVVPRITIREIDQHKDQSRGKIQKRAKVISAKFAQAFLEEKTFKYPFALCDEPAASSFDGGKFNIHINDDWFILSALHSNYDVADIVVISSDTNLLLKAKENGLNFKRMLEKYQLKEELSDEEKEIKALKVELEKYRNRQPKLSILFENRDSKIIFKKPQERDLKEELILYMRNLKNKNPYEKKTNIDLYNSLGISLPLYSQEQIDQYNQELNDYFKEEEEYRHFLLQKEILDERFREISFCIKNDGTDQTGDMDIFIEFPAHVKLYNKYSKTSRDDVAPIIPQINGINRKLLQSITIDKYMTPFRRDETPQLYCWDINQTIEDREFKFHRSNLNHKLILALDIEDSIYIDTGICGSFDIQWYVVDSKQINPIEGTLNVIIK